MRLSVLGPPELVRDDGSPAGLAPGKTLAVLIYLAHATSPPSRADLTRLFWPNSDPAKARHSVRQTLSLIRKVIGEEAFASDDPVKLNSSTLTTDTHEFLEALGAGEIETAEQLWRGTFVEGLVLADAPEWTRWVEERQLALEHRMCDALTMEAEAAQFCTDRGVGQVTEDAIRLLRRAISIDPYRERPRLVLADLLTRQGKLDEAADEIAEARRALGEDTDGIRQLEVLIETEVRRRYAAGDADPAPALGELFVGRTTEMSRLLGAWARAEQGVVVTAVVEGPAGIGKTRLTRELAEHVRDRGGIVAFTSPLPAEASISGGVLRDLETALIAGIGGRAHGPASSAHDTQLEAADRLMDLLRAPPAPVLLVVDDLQWADPLTRAVLARVHRQLERTGCLFLFTIRSEAADPLVKETIGELLELPGSTGIELGPLSEDEVRELLALAARIEDLEGNGALARFLEMADGSPLYIIELLRTLAESGALATSNSGQLSLTGPLPDPLPFPKGVRALLERRLAVLPDDAITVAAHIASADGRAGVDELQEATGLEASRFSRGLGVLLNRGILRWAGPTDLAFAHEEVRRTVASTYPLASDVEKESARRRERRFGWAAVGLATIPIAVAVGWKLLGPGGIQQPDPPPPFGGGEIVFVNRQHVSSIRPIRDDPENTPDGDSVRFEIGGVETLPNDVFALAGPFRTTDGERVWYGRVTEGEEPPWIARIEADGSVTEFARSDWDENQPVLSPDGAYVAWVRARMMDGRYQRELRIARADGSDARTIRTSERALDVRGWSTSGRFLFVASADPDATAQILTPAGRVVAGHPFDGEVHGAWCGPDDRYVVSGVQNGVRSLFVAAGPDRQLERIDTTYLLQGQPGCSPDGSALVYFRAVDGRPAAVIHELATGSVRMLPAPDERPRDARPIWVPDSLPPVVVGPALARDSVTIDWGDTLRLGSAVRYSDGSERNGELAWDSSDPAIASVQANGHMSANGPGTAWIRATAAGWIRDSILIEVRATDRTDVILREEFSTLDPERWIVFGTPPARAIQRGDTTALELRGDGNYHDGVLSAEAFSLRGGATLEFSFRMPVTRDHWQRLAVCLLDAGPDVEHWRGIRGFSPGVREAACLQYPSDELTQFDPTEVALAVGGEPGRVVLPDELPADNWIHVAIQVRGDGAVTFLLNRRRIGDVPIRLSQLEPARWRVRLNGKAVDTELLVRQLVVWRGARFGVE